MFAGEAVINELAAKLDMDPMDLRLKNASKEGDDRPMGGTVAAHRQRRRSWRR